MLKHFQWLVLAALGCAVLPAHAAEPAKHVKWRWEEMDNGPFFSSNIEGPNPVLKSITIKLGKDEEAAVSFDTMTLRMAIGWTGGFLQLPKGRDGLEGVPRPNGEVNFHTPQGPGWARGGDFTDPRKEKYGPLQAEYAKWKGLYLNGGDVILSYTVAGTPVLELPSYEADSGLQVFTRVIEIGPTKDPLSLMVAEDTAMSGNATATMASLMSTGKGMATAAGLLGTVEGAKFEILEGKKLVLRLPPLKKSVTFGVAIWHGNAADLPRFSTFASSKSKLPSLAKLTKGGAKHWGAPLITQGKLGTGDGPYVVDTLTMPEPNPYNSWMRLSGVDFFSDGRAAVCSVSGDVWIVSGIDDKLNKVTWQRYATGLFQPLGIKVLKDKVYVLGRDQITRLHDLNKDGEADFYESFNNDVMITPEYHEFALNLEADSKGNFYFNKGGNLGNAKMAHHGSLMRVSADGKKLEAIANGLRAPNGMGMGPHDEITTSDNEGNWVPACRINLMKPGGFYGHVFTAHRKPEPTTYDPPMFWVPKSIDNSSGGQVWVTSDKWGPLKGQMLHMAYGTCLLFNAAYEIVDGIPQGGVVKFPLKFDSGIMRGHFRKQDGQLYVVGLVVWQSNGARQGAFHRVRYTGKPVDMPVGVKVRKNGLELTFTNPLDPKSVADGQNFAIEQWNYKWTQNYGSPEFSVKDPNKKAHDPVEIKSVKLLADKKTIFIEIPEIQPVMQMKVKYNVKSADGREISQEFYNTINVVPKS